MITTTSTVTSVTPAAGSNVSVTFPYRFDEEEHLLVYRVSSAGVRTTLTEGVHYSVSGAGDSGGGTLVINTVTSGDAIIVAREVDITQQQDYVANAKFPADSHEGQMDKQIMIDQQLQYGLDRSIKVHPGEPTPVVGTRKNRQDRFPVYDANGDYTEWTAAQLWTALPVPTGTISGAGMKFFADEAARNSAAKAPDQAGQLGTQIDTGVVYRGTGVAAGNWVPIAVIPHPVSTAAELATAITDIASTKDTISVVKSFALTANVDIPDNIALFFPVPGVQIDTAGFELSIDGSVDAAPNRQIFTNFSAGDIYGKFGGGDRYVGWWGAQPDFEVGVSFLPENKDANGVTRNLSYNWTTKTLTTPVGGDIYYTINSVRTISNALITAQTEIDPATDRITLPSHGLADEQACFLITSIANPLTDVLPTPLAESFAGVAPYNVILIDSNTIELEEGVGSGTIDITGYGSGTFTLIPTSQDILTIDGSANTTGDVIILRAQRDDASIVLKDVSGGGGGNLSLTGGSDVTLDNITDWVALQWSGTQWVQIAETAVPRGTGTDSTVAIQAALSSGKNSGISGSIRGTGNVVLGSGRYLVSANLDMRETTAIVKGQGVFSTSIYVDDRDDATGFPTHKALFLMGHIWSGNEEWGDYATGIRDIDVRFRSRPQAKVGLMKACGDIGEPTFLCDVWASHAGAPYIDGDVLKSGSAYSRMMNLRVEDCTFGSLNWDVGQAILLSRAGYTASIKRNTFNLQQLLNNGLEPQSDGITVRSFGPVVIENNHFEDCRRNISIETGTTATDVLVLGNDSINSLIGIYIDSESALPADPISVNVLGFKVDPSNVLRQDRSMKAAILDRQVGVFTVAEHGYSFNYRRQRHGTGLAGTAYAYRGELFPVNSSLYQPPGLLPGKTFAAATAVDTSDNSFKLAQHGFNHHERVILETDTKLPTELSLFRPYYIVHISEAKVGLSEYPSGPTISISDTGTGTHTIRKLAGNIRTIKDAASASKTFTTAGATNNLNIASHGFYHTQPVHFKTSPSSVLPTGLSENTQYFVIYTDADNISLSLTAGGLAVTLTNGSGSGTNTIHPTGYIVLPSPAWDSVYVDGQSGGSNLGLIYWNEDELNGTYAQNFEGKELILRAFSLVRDINLIHGLGLSASDNKYGLSLPDARDITLTDTDQFVDLRQLNTGKWCTVAQSAPTQAINTGSLDTLTISSGAITITKSFHILAGEFATTDSLTTIKGGTVGQILVLSNSQSSYTITVTDGATLQLAGDFAMDSSNDSITLIKINSTTWRELSRSDNA